MNKKGINIPDMPGIFPLTDINKLKKFCSVARTTIPRNTEELMCRFINQPDEMEKLGIDLTIKQCKDLIKNGHQRLHFFTFNKLGMIKTILDAIVPLL
jgi:methylenetetrahydrofolate reductase (NADPH)